jgi:2,4-diketo-3-deoxy-L-fuconate hydrolase
LAKSFPNFGPVGPYLVTLDEFADPNALELSCTVNGVEMQGANTSDMIFSVPELVAYVSSIVTLYPGDLIFTGTPHGVGAGRNPRVFLQTGDVLESTIAGIGTMRQSFR